MISPLPNSKIVSRSKSSIPRLLLTALGRQRFAEYDRRAGAHERAVDIMFDTNGEVWLAGIPARGDFRRLQRLLRDAGANVAISQDRSGSTNPGAAPE